MVSHIAQVATTKGERCSFFSCLVIQVLTCTTFSVNFFQYEHTAHAKSMWSTPFETQLKTHLSSNNQYCVWRVLHADWQISGEFALAGKCHGQVWIGSLVSVVNWLVGEILNKRKNMKRRPRRKLMFSRLTLLLQLLLFFQKSLNWDGTALHIFSVFRLNKLFVCQVVNIVFCIFSSLCVCVQCWVRYAVQWAVLSSSCLKSFSSSEGYANKIWWVSVCLVCLSLSLPNVSHTYIHAGTSKPFTTGKIIIMVSTHLHTKSLIFCQAGLWQCLSVVQINLT